VRPAAPPADPSAPDDAALLALRRSADPPADAAIAAMLRPWDEPGAGCVNRERLREANAAIALWRCNGELAGWRAPPGTAPEVAAALEAYVASTHLLPAWAEPARIEQAERVFMEQGLLSCALLFCASLPECYVLPALAEVLITTGQLESRAEHRIRSTAAMIFPVMMEGGLTRPGGGGVAQVLKVRLIHAMVRHLVLRASPEDALARAHEPPPPAATGDAMADALLARGWDTAALGLPCNQFEMGYTLLTFGFVMARAQRRLGVALAPEEELAALHAWNVVGHLVGVRPELTVRTMDDAEALFARLQALGRDRVPAPDPRPPLAAVLMGTMADAIPWRAAKPVPLLLTRRLVGRVGRETLALDAQVATASKLLFALGFALVRTVDAVARLAWPRFSLARLATRVLGYHALTRLLLDQTRPLALPAQLREQIDRTALCWRGDPAAPRWVNRLEHHFTAGAGQPPR
jgi:hypothetical protein